jgi:hypothetical protein
MRTSIRCAVLALFGLAPALPAVASVPPDRIFPANFEAPPDCLPAGSAGCPGFVVATNLEVAAAEALSLCYYFRTGTAGTIGIGRFSSHFGPAVHNIVVYTTVDSTTKLPADRQPPGTLASTNCGSGNFNNTTARRIYSAHHPAEQLRMPDDDGAAQPLALELPANAAGFIEIYVVNNADQALDTSVELTANGRADAQPYTTTATYVAYNLSISIPAMSTKTETEACPVPDPASFWWFSTETHRRATSATLRKGAATILTTSDWESPAIATYTAPSFYQFGAGEKLTYECAYTNDGPAPVSTGDSYEFDEVCIGVGYYFPADEGYCFNSSGPFSQ